MRRAGDDFDDSRSDTSYMTSQMSQYNAGAGYQSNMSSAIKNPPVFANNLAN